MSATIPSPTVDSRYMRSPRQRHRGPGPPNDSNAFSKPPVLWRLGKPIPSDWYDERGPAMRNVAVLGTRVVLGGYLAAHGAQKLFGSFGGPGIEAAGAGFEQMGPDARQTDGHAGIGLRARRRHPHGHGRSLAHRSDRSSRAMTVASTVHRQAGPFAMGGGYELPLTNASVALLLATTDPGKLRIPLNSRQFHTTIAIAVGAALTAHSLNKLLRAQAASSAASPTDSAASSDGNVPEGAPTTPAASTSSAS